MSSPEATFQSPDLPERLRLIGKTASFPGHSIYDEAARGLEQQAAEIERLRADLAWIATNSFGAVAHRARQALGLPELSDGGLNGGTDGLETGF